MLPILRLFALIADGERGALVGPAGEMVWMCLPSWDGEAVFTSLLGGAGAYAVTPIEEFVWGGYYEAGSLIWRSRWVLVGGGEIECREALAFPADPERVILLRRVLARKGQAHVRVALDPRADFGRQPLRHLQHCDHGIWTARTGAFHVRWNGGDHARKRKEGGLALELNVNEGQCYDLVLEMSRQPFHDPPPDAGALWARTEKGWQEAVTDLRISVAERDARHACAVLRGLTTSRGGLVAAATTSLPERANSGRNYDYRYVWIRDQCYAGQAAAAVGAKPLLRQFVQFVRARLLEDGPHLRPAYTTAGGKVPDESKLDHLLGYAGGDQVIIGNRAGKQFQLDALAEALLLFAAAARAGCFDAEDWRAAELAVAAIEQRWHEPGSGIWEVEDRCWTHSRLICVAGLRSLAKGAAPPPVAARWTALADAIVAETDAHALHPTGRWQRSAEDERVDASLLLPALRGAVEPQDPRHLATLRAIEQELVQDGYCYRFRSSLPLSESEGAFTICGYWMALAYAQLGRWTEAARWFERARTACGPPGLFAEEYDVVQRELRGNLPQAFVHALMLECAAELRF